jgi:hypothetical protein
VILTVTCWTATVGITINSKRLDDLLDIYQLQRHIDKPTRRTDSTKTLIDFIITKSDDTKTFDSGVIALGISDHDLVYICRKIGVPRETPKIVQGSLTTLHTTLIQILPGRCGSTFFIYF